jgi:hypothetical protein
LPQTDVLRVGEAAEDSTAGVELSGFFIRVAPRLTGRDVL